MLNVIRALLPNLVNHRRSHSSNNSTLLYMRLTLGTWENICLSRSIGGGWDW